MTKTISGSYSSTYTLTDQYTTVVDTGTVSVLVLTAIYGPTGGPAWTVTNSGTLISAGGYGFGVELHGAGVNVTNNAGGVISGGEAGIYLYDDGTVVNHGAIRGINNFEGVILGFGGIVTNTGSSATISATKDGVYLNAGGLVTNGAGATISGGGYGVYARQGIALLTNAGTIHGGTAGIRLTKAAIVTNQATGQIIGDSGPGAEFVSYKATLTNYGTIAGGGLGKDAVLFAPGVGNLLVDEPGAVFTGTVDGGNTIGATAASTLELAGGSSTGTFSGLGSKYIDFDQLTIDAGATWNFSGANTLVSGSTLTDSGTLDAGSLVTTGTILMAGGTLTDASGLSLGSGASSGSLSGFGTVTANLTGSGSGTADTVTASGGTLDLTGTFGAGLVAAIDAGSVSTLKFDNIATSNAAIAITSPDQTLEIGTGGELTIGASQNVTRGAIKLDGGIIIDLGVGGISFGTGPFRGSLSGFGDVIADQLTRSGSGTADTIIATGGTLRLFTTIGNDSGLVFNIDNSSTSSLQLDIAPGTGNTFTFLGSAGNLALEGSETYDVGVNHLNVGGTSAPTNFVDILGTPGVTVTSGETGTGASGTVVLSNTDTLSLTGITSVSGTWHVLTAADSAGTGTDVFLSALCYAAGTHILTATGERAIESLSQGDIVLALSGEELKPQPVKWLGHRRIDQTAHPRPETVAPIRIERDAIAAGMPHRDLVVSPDHAIFIEGKLICARQLVNGTSIRQEFSWTAVDYYHVELDQHAILMAEGLPAESYIDTGHSGFFSNSGEPLLLHPDLSDKCDCPTREAGSCAPFVSDAASVQPVWQRLADRAAAIGRPVPQHLTTTDADLRLLVDQRTVKPVFSDSDRVTFILPRGAREVRLVSRAQSPTAARPWLDDRRHLGVRVKRIVLRGADEVREVPVDHPDLSRGWWAVERDGQVMSRWTDGEAVLPLLEMQGTVMLEVHLAGSMTYAVDAVPADGTERRAAA